MKFVLHEPSPRASYETIAAMVGCQAAERDRDGGFPYHAFDGLRALGLIARPPLALQDAASLLRLLAAVGRGDLSAGRIFEGHTNALFLLQRYGTEAQRHRYQDLAAAGHIFGVWNTDLPGEPVTLDGTRLCGKKNFASGIDGLSHAIITATQHGARLMLMVPVAGLPVDRSWWRPLGMRASGSHVVDLTGIVIAHDWILGDPDDYLKEPWFSAGAIRFVAVHVGGMHAVFDAAVSHLRATRRIADPYQRHRIGRIGIAVEAGYAWLEHAARFWAHAERAHGAGIVAIAGAARTAIEQDALHVLEMAEQSVGAAGFLAPHPLERLVRDLRTYLRQPNPDGALAALGATIAEHDWEPGRAFDDGRN